MTLYEYSPLRFGYIRVFRLLPAVDHGSVLWGDFTLLNLHYVTRVKANEVDDRPPSRSPANYEALSYAWGKEDKPRVLSTSSGTIAITESLFSGLTRLRKTDVERFIWADAICINQVDLEEKESQIGMMADIYSLAARVICDLGEATDDGDFEAMKVMKSARTDWAWTIEARAECRVALLQLLTRPWFGRLWVVQEFFLASRVALLLGRECFDWKSLMTALLRTTDRTNAGTVMQNWPYLSLCTQRYKHDQEFTREPLITNIQRYSYRKVGNPRDRYFALLAMSSDAFLGELAPDYRSPISVIIRRFGRHFLTASEGIKALCVAGIHGVTCDNCSQGKCDNCLPSWMPNFTRVGFRRHPLLMDDRFLACGPVSARLQIDHRGDHLRLIGAYVDRVTNVLVSDDDDLPNPVTMCREAIEFFLCTDDPDSRNMRYPYTRQPKIDAAWQTICHHGSPGTASADLTSSLDRGFRYFHRSLLASTGKKSKSVPEAQNPDDLQAQSVFFKAFSGKSR
ncbi:uncharacterized protein E0L32_002084 [Thyridium curvatum]|uniref:Heterokaryon incompatibility domain-containing protein n=1 Tax=Thyridium curvatum TaxID=1093900 RepID=A0A507ALS3_9PEZI|nr:uncharacterized protein E0L32_002049 [Thyridium curvatum]XP_030989192.1 uncharacterized protein E0L32_002084 [Thyridium curvatum]TPX07446.1 hypothetical protein E0L32_002049 [Thyridium curvatum]TPX07481.1 hypothetical protein E0L32_002084 [Thyridium curvatum]